MTAFIKKRLLKELAKFTKGLKPEQIELHTLRGEGELRGLELDERFLTAVLEFPVWLRLTKCTCDRVRLKVHWAHLGSKPLHVHIDKVAVHMETCQGEEERMKAELGKLSSGKYGMMDKVIDGMHVSIDHIAIDVSSPGFVAKVELFNLDVHSTTPNWKIDRLNKTRIVLENLNMVTTFKQVIWQNLKVDFSSEKATQTDAAFSPLKLLTSQGQLNITVRKRLSDCAVECGRLEVILEEYLLWVLTLSQLKEAVLFAQKLSDIIRLAKEKSRKAQPVTPISVKDPVAPVNSRVGDAGSMQTRLTSQHADLTQYSWYVKETSHHLRLGTLHLQLCDDSQVSCLSDDVRGSMHVSCNDLSIDFHPKHPTLVKRTHWPVKNRYTEERDTWVHCLLKNQAGKIKAESQKHVISWKELYESSFILGCSKFSLTYYASAEVCGNQQPFLSSDNTINQLPSQTTAFQLDYTTYFYQRNIQLPVPHSNFHLSVNPVQLTIEPSVCLWLVSFVKAVFDTLWRTDLNAQLSGPVKQQTKGSSDCPVDILLFFLLPTITIPVEASSDSQFKQPHAVQVQGAKVTATNCSRDGRSQAAVDELISNLTEFQEKKLFCCEQSAEFPSHEDDLRAIPQVACSESKQNPSLLRASSVWSFFVDQCWAQFLPMAKEDGEPVRPEQFLGSVPISGWVVVPTGFEGKNEMLTFEPDIYTIVRITDTVVARLNHSEYLFLFTLRDIIQQLLTDMSKLLYETSCEDTANTASESLKLSMAALVDDIHISIVPPQDQIQSEVQSHYTVHETVNECDEGISPEQSGESSVSVDKNSATDCETTSLKEFADSSMARPASAGHIGTPEASHNLKLQSVMSSTSLPAVGCHIQHGRCSSEGDIPAVTVTKPQQSGEGGIGEEYDIIDRSELGSSTSLSSQGSSMSGGSYSGLIMTEFVKGPHIQTDALHSLQQFETSSSNDYSFESPFGESTPSQITEATAPVELKTECLLVDQQMPQGYVIKHVTQADPVIHDSVRDTSCGQSADDCSSVSSAQQCQSALNTVVVMELRLKETQLHSQVNEEGFVIKVASGDIWVKEDQLTSTFLTDLEHKRRRQSISSACHPGGMEKAQMELRFHVLVANNGEEADYLAYVKVNGMVTELQLPTALAMFDFIADDAIPISSSLPFIVEVSKSQFGIRIPELDDRLMMKYRERGLTYRPSPLVFQVEKVKIRRGMNGIFIVEEIGDHMMAQPLVTEHTVMKNADESKTPLTCDVECDQDKVVESDVTETKLPCCTDTDAPVNQLQKPKTLCESAEGNNDGETEQMARENAILKQSVDTLKSELVALQQIAEAAQLGKQELIKLISTLQEELEDAETQKQQMEDQVISMKSLLLAQELAADGIAESPKWQRRSPDKKL